MTGTIDLHPIAGPLNLPALPGCRAVSTHIAWNGDVLQLWVPESAVESLFAHDEREGWASFPKTHTDQPYSATLVVTGPTGQSQRTLPLLTATLPIVQLLPGGATLVVAPRCAHLQDGIGELNARIVDADGFACDFCLGDGILHVQTGSDGRIWAGYFDEGVFGNFGWGIGMGPEPLGSAGLVCYDRAGKPIWKYTRPEGLPPIADCYALNVTDDCVWACYYTDFPIVRIDSQGEVTGWETDLRGPRAIAVSGTSVLAFGGYFEHAADCALLTLAEGYAEKLAGVTLRLPGSVDLEKTLVLARGPILYVIDHEEVFRFAVPPR